MDEKKDDRVVLEPLECKVTNPLLPNGQGQFIFNLLSLLIFSGLAIINRFILVCSIDTPSSILR